MAQVARFTISTPSRHPANQNAYDASRHRYQPDYINPPSWELTLMAFPKGLTEDDNGRQIIPPEIKALRWTVAQVGGSFSQKVNRTRSATMLRAAIRVPEAGTYDITLRLELTTGEPVSQTRRYRLRDFLIVSIGDSFASGEGNPDIPATPSASDRATCEATTLKMLAIAVETKVGDFLQEVEAQSEGLAAEYIPFVGAIAVSIQNGVEGAKRWVKSKITDLKDAVVDLVVTGVVEAAEEVAGWFGIGDGGESEDLPRPAAWQEPNAHRSYRSGHSLAARQIETDTTKGADRVTFITFARSGSEIGSGLLGPRLVDIPGQGNRSADAWAGDRGQISEARDAIAGRSIDALIVTIGVNDLGFDSLVTDSILWPGVGNRQERVDRAREKVEGALISDFALLDSAIRDRLAPRHVFLTEYPVGVFREIELGQKPCGVLGSASGLNLNFGEAADLGELGSRLNARLRQVAETRGWTLVGGIERGFDGHGYCAADSYFVSAEESCRNQGDFNGMLHPNGKGHEVTRDAIVHALEKHLVSGADEWLEPVLHVMMN